MLFIFLSLLELAVVGFMSRNEGAPEKTKKRNFNSNEITWIEMPSPRIGLRKVSGSYVREKLLITLFSKFFDAKFKFFFSSKLKPENSFLNKK